jgi:hypothetical protein
MLGTFIDTDGNTKANQAGDNVGVQYGLKALQAGTITAEDFVKLNQGWAAIPPTRNGPARPRSRRGRPHRR